MNVHLVGEANDYVGKGMAGGHVSIVPPPQTVFAPEDASLVGNTCLYGATGGSLFVNGRAGVLPCGCVPVHACRARQRGSAPEVSSLVGSTCLFGATSSSLFVNGRAGELRSSSASAPQPGCFRLVI